MKKRKEKFRIGIDGRFFGSENRGLGRYTQKLIEGLEKKDAKNEYYIFLRNENWNKFKPQNHNFKKVMADYRWYTLAEQILLPPKIRKIKLDLVHFPHFNAPVFYTGKFIVTIHDLILFHFPTKKASTLNPVFYKIKEHGYRYVIRSAVKRSNKVIAVSEFTKKDILDVFSSDPDKISVIKEGVSPNNIRASASLKNQLFRKHGIEKPYILYVGSAYPHKNLDSLIKSFQIIRKECGNNIQLVLVSDKGFFYQRLRRKFKGKADNIIFTDYVLDDDLRLLYQEADIYVFPSLYEGFGLPPLEAMSHGVPVVSSNSASIPEVLGEAAVYFDPKSPQDIASKVVKVLKDEKMQDKLKSLGIQQAKQYSWERMAEDTLSLYMRALNQ